MADNSKYSQMFSKNQQQDFNIIFAPICYITNNRFAYMKDRDNIAPIS